jgi:hypothetical protein
MREAELLMKQVRRDPAGRSKISGQDGAPLSLLEEPAQIPVSPGNEAPIEGETRALL